MIVVLENIRPGSFNVNAVDAKLRKKFPSLLGWSYGFLDDALTLEFPNSEVETVIEDKISDALSKVRADYPDARHRESLLKGGAVRWAT